MTTFPDTTFNSRLNEFRIEERYCDIVLHCRGIKYHAHRVVLAAGSAKLDSLMTDDGIMDLKFPDELNDHSVRQLLNFLYLGSVVIDQISFIPLLKLAIELRINGLLTLCCSNIDVNVKLSNLYSLIDLSVKSDLSDIRKSIACLFRDDYKTVCDDSNFVNLPVGLFMSLMKTDELKMIIADAMLYAITLWLSTDLKQRKRYIISMFALIDWSGLSTDFVEKFLSNLTDAFVGNEDCLYVLLLNLKRTGFSLGKYSELYDVYSAKFHDLHEMQDVAACYMRLHDADTSFAITTTSQEYRYLAESCTDSESIDDIVSEIDAELGKMLKDHNSKCDKYIVEFKPKKIAQARSRTRKFYDNDDDDDDDKKYVNMDSQDIMPSAMDIDNQMMDKESEMSEVFSHTSDNDIKDTIEAEGLKVEIEKTRENVHEPLLNALNKIQNAESATEKGTGNIVKCNEEDCDYETVTDGDMERHLITVHSLKTNMKCPICGFTCCYGRVYNTHMLVHFPGPPFSCDEGNCQFVSHRLQALLSHRFVHLTQRPYECKVCDETFKLKRNFEAHKLQHNQMKPFGCDKCDKQFASRSMLKQHEMTHSEHHPFLCDLCGFSTKYHSHLASHKKIHTGNVLRCTQPGCTYSTPKKNVFAAHLRSHSQVRSHICDHCGERFIERSHMVRHSRIHREDAWFACDLCEYSTSRRDKYSQHRARYHIDATSRPYSRRKTRLKTASYSDVITSQIAPNYTVSSLHPYTTVSTVQSTVQQCESIHPRVLPLVLPQSGQQFGPDHIASLTSPLATHNSHTLPLNEQLSTNPHNHPTFRPLQPDINTNSTIHPIRSTPCITVPIITQPANATTHVINYQTPISSSIDLHTMNRALNIQLPVFTTRHDDNLPTANALITLQNACPSVPPPNPETVRVNQQTVQATGTPPLYLQTSLNDPRLRYVVEEQNKTSSVVSNIGLTGEYDRVLLGGLSYQFNARNMQQLEYYLPGGQTPNHHLA